MALIALFEEWEEKILVDAMHRLILSTPMGLVENAEFSPLPCSIYAFTSGCQIEPAPIESLQSGRFHAAEVIPVVQVADEKDPAIDQAFQEEGEENVGDR